MTRSSVTMPTAVSTRRCRTQPGASCLLFMAAAPAGQDVDAAVDRERRDEQDQGDRRGASEVELLELVHDQQRRDLGVPGPGDEDDRAVLADGAGEREGHTGEE